MREQTTMGSVTAEQGRHRGASTTLASLAAIGSVLVASSCCLPLLPFVMAAGLAGSSAFLLTARPYLLFASMVFIAFGFYQVWRSKQCQRRPPSTVSSVMLWVAALLVVVSIFFPGLMANAAADLLGR